MSFDFPNTPSIGDLFQDSTTGAVYQWNGYAWVGGVTGIGLQTIKETRYLTAGSFTHTRDPKNSSGLGDIHLLGACGGRIAVTWASGQLVLGCPGSTGAIGIKWKYPLAPSCPVVVGASSLTTTAGASSFDTVLTVGGGGIGGGSAAAAAGSQTAQAGPAGQAGATCDENYNGQQPASFNCYLGFLIGTAQVTTFLRDVMRRGAGYTYSTTANIPAALGDPGVVVVVEYLNP